MQICPSILESSSADFVFQLKRLSPYFSYFQIDIADGIFVPNKTLQIEEIIQTFQPSNHLAMKPLIFDFHLMVKDYEKEIERLRNWEIKEIKIKNIFIHYSLLPNCQLLIPNCSFSPGLVLNPKDQVSDLSHKYNLNKIPAIQIMSVNPGRQGSDFLPDTLKKIGQLRQMGYRYKIFLDGAINNQSLPFILQQKFLPDVICPGSFLTHAKDLKKIINHLKERVLVKEETTSTN